MKLSKYISKQKQTYDADSQAVKDGKKRKKHCHKIYKTNMDIYKQNGVPMNHKQKQMMDVLKKRLA